MRSARSIGAVALAALALSACGSGAHTPRGAGPDAAVAPSTAAADQTVTMVQTRFPDSLDPQSGASTESTEATWVTYTGLVSYAHRSGPAGATLIPGLATAMPRISDGGRVYTVILRRGLVYSDGRPVRARDFLYSLERAVRLRSSGAGELLDPTVVGAAAFAAGRANSISGVSVDDRTREIVIHLTGPDGAFDNVLAEPFLGLVPASRRPFIARPLDPPPGCGPYVIEKVVAGRSYSLRRNRRWTPLPGIPAARVNVDVKVSPNVTADAEAVLNNTADILDPAATVPARLVDEIQSQARGRFALLDTGVATDYVFLNQAERPFSSELARRAVVVALDHDTLGRIAGGTIAAGCFLLPAAVTGHPRDVPCPDGALGAGDLAAARALVRRSGMEGQPVLVWSPAGSPRAALMAYYTRLLRAIGFQAQQRPVDAGVYAATVGNLEFHPQTGFGDLGGAPPNPIDIYGRLLDGRSISQQGNENLGEVDQPSLNREIARLSRSPSPSNSAWVKLDESVARHADVAVIGYQRFPFFASARMDYPALKINPVYGWDDTSLQLK